MRGNRSLAKVRRGGCHGAIETFNDIILYLELFYRAITTSIDFF